MISIVVYGRNDSHGYNFHKRAVISLNCLAEVLDGPDDEIIFVDYNTTDELPPFVEAVADTLTAKARRLMRVIRVRPDFHQRNFARRTHLQCVESVSRNIGIRRTNPANRWLIATNLDMMVLPRAAEESLTSVVARLADGFYELPRFEVPESVWECFDRLDARGTLRTIRELGPRLHLNEVVWSDPTVVFDGPGDFQLMLRDDVFAIGGFDESMLAGWHLDSNLCKRIELYRQQPNRSLLEHAFAYHCDHTRQVTTVHSHDRVENDLQTCVFELVEPIAKHQIDTWGAPGEIFEEFHAAELGSGRFVEVLERVLPPSSTPISSERLFHPSSFNDLRYSPEHVVPFLASLIATRPRTMQVGWFGVTPRLLELFARAAHALGFEQPILVDVDAPLLLASTMPAHCMPADMDTIDRAADILVFEAGAPGSGSPSAQPKPASFDDLSRVAYVRRRLLHLADRELARTADIDVEERTFVVVNAQLNQLEGTVNGVLACALTPFSGGLRHGPVRRHAPVAQSVDDSLRRAASMLARDLGRTSVGQAEINQLLRLVRAMASGRDPELDPTAVATELLALLSLPGAPALTGLGTDELERASTNVRDARSSRTLRELVVPGSPLVAPSQRAISRVAAYEDWDDPAFLATARRALGFEGCAESTQRGWWAWARVQLLHGLEQLGALDRLHAALVVATEADVAPGLLADHAHRVYVHDPLGVLDADALASGAVLCDRTRIEPWGGELFDAPRATPFDQLDLAFIAKSAFHHYGLERLPAVLAALGRRMTAGGTIVLETIVGLDPFTGEGLLDQRTVTSELLPELLASVGMHLHGPFDTTVSDRTLDAVGRMFAVSGTRVLIPGLWFITVESSDATAQDWAGLTQRFEQDVARRLAGPIELSPGDALTLPVCLAAPGGVVELNAHGKGALRCQLEGVAEPLDLALPLEGEFEATMPFAVVTHAGKPSITFTNTTHATVTLDRVVLRPC